VTPTGQLESETENNTIKYLDYIGGLF
jgi:hypothetical protein